jgi:hypothetical protein
MTTKKGNDLMRKYLLLLTALMAAILTSSAQAPAFPGAEGHGRFVTGGRGGSVIHVTNLADSGTGSLREAVKGNAKKIIVFDVAGVIALASDLDIGNNTTIEGQTAPSPGITIRYYTVRPGSNNIIRFIRIRRGQEKDLNDGADACWNRQKTGIILDHCSFSWSIDEVASFYDNNNFTMQWCTIAESLTNAGHNKGAHGFGGIWGGKLASFHHNLLQHLQNRTPRFNGARYQWAGYTSNSEYNTYQWENYVQAEIVDFRNCVMYNWGNGNGCYGGPGGGYINMVNNYYKAGPATSNKTRVTQVTVAASGNTDSDKYTSRKVLLGMTSRYFIHGNYVTAASASERENYDWKGVIYDNGTYTINGERYSVDPNHFYGDKVTYKKNSSGTDCVSIKLDQEVPSGIVTTHTATEAFEKVLGYAGASMYRDEVDERYMTEARNGTATYTGSVTKQKGIIDVVADVNGYTEANFGTGAHPSDWDTDKDGMPDIWEEANGLDPDNAADAMTYTLDPKGYYTNVEVYCNALVEEMMKQQNADAVKTVDEYYPTVAKVEGIPYYGADNTGSETGDEEEEVQFTISADTYTGSPSDTEWSFQEGITVTNNNGKTYSTGKEKGVKYSANVPYTIHLPEKYHVKDITFTGYDNYAETDAYIKEINGTTYDATTYVFPQKNANGQYTVTSHQVHLNTPATGTLTFTPAGKQVVWVIKLNGSFKEDTPPLLGDANEDKVVDVTDVMCIVNHILGNEVTPFNTTNVDADGNGLIDVTDVMVIVSIILNSQP